MTIEVPPTADATATKQAKKELLADAAKRAGGEATTAASEKDDEPSLSIQIEPPTNTLTGEELMPTIAAEEKSATKRKGFLNNPFAKGGPKKDVSDEITTNQKTNESATSTPIGENRIIKGFGNFLSKVKRTASSNNIKELSDPSPTAAAALDEGENGQEETEGATATAAEENIVTETEIPTVTDQSNAKRQSFLSKLFGGGNNAANKKKEEIGTTTDEENDGAATSELQRAANTETSNSNPPLTRRVTGFFAKKIPKLDKNQKSTDKVEVPGEEAAADTEEVVTTHAEEDATATAEEKKEEPVVPAIVVAAEENSSVTPTAAAVQSS